MDMLYAKLDRQRVADLLRAPVQLQLVLHEIAQRLVVGQFARGLGRGRRASAMRCDHAVAVVYHDDTPNKINGSGQTQPGRLNAKFNTYAETHPRRNTRPAQ